MMYRHLIGLFQAESDARGRIVQRGPIDEYNFQALNDRYEDRNLIYSAQHEQVFCFKDTHQNIWRVCVRTMVFLPIPFGDGMVILNFLLCY